MIRLLKVEDINYGVNLLKENVKEFDFGQFEDDNTEYYKGLLDACVKDKTVIVSEDNGKINGTIIAIRVPNLLNPKNIQLHVLVNWVDKDKRNSSIFYRMYKKFEKDIIKDNEEVIFYSVKETNIKFDKLGYKQFQTMYLKGK